MCRPSSKESWNNILIMKSSSGYKLFAANIEAKDTEITCFDAHIIPDDESLELTHNKDDNLSDGEEKNQNPSATSNMPTPKDKVTTAHTPYYRNHGATPHRDL
jgi:hypothetical protein